MSTEKKADFSGVSAKVDSTAEVVPKADFSGVTSTVDSTAEIAGEQQYTVQKGDSLSKIAKQHLGDANAWKRIFEANRDVLDDPDKIFPGQTLRLPPRQG
ncbi:LysM peptidoglycan-binding domain-containing protein [Flavobacterium sp. MXW15]|uniref:LysM peptidoglycan-binding domain-containing protein n=1 Tax=Xanthomonas chitinilytica TaxID=2989819 RepID=A0ABT3JYS0_9XANT|nr:LysM peptidoglycan-binding domain-containing protein [Xanthomonas sp. H13-6]MCW4456046.1 LysM peptidoglycan-binding domain-containing protein [Flavobacterium sp. MXW15]MCW4473643.1 LysM peptidoglycan-binding domain-containing protein [Xanthomonas sp. H13-6]